MSDSGSDDGGSSPPGITKETVFDGFFVIRRTRSLSRVGKDCGYDVREVLPGSQRRFHVSARPFAKPFRFRFNTATLKFITTRTLDSGILNTKSKIGQLIINGSQYFDYFTIGLLKTEIIKHKDKVINSYGI